MQTFLPYPDFVASAKVLDYRRLGKQRVETYQILRALTGESAGWRNHPATKMWRGYEEALSVYGRAMCQEWIDRGYADTMIERFKHYDEYDLPPWMGNEAFHRSHQSNLIRKDPAFYSEKFAGVPDDLEYVWPTPEVYTELAPVAQ